MNMKSMCCVVLILAFLMYYQTNPVFTIVIVVVGLGVYIFYKSKTSGSSSGSGLSQFLSGRAPQEDNRNIDDLVSLIMLQQLITSSPDDRIHGQIDQDLKKSQENRLEKIQNEVLELLESE